LTAAPNNDSHGGADRLTRASIALWADRVAAPVTNRHVLKKIAIEVAVRLWFKLILRECGLNSTRRSDGQIELPVTALTKSLS
jgi:hypothetical protein